MISHDKTTTFPTERRTMRNHDVLLIPKVASTSLRWITQTSTHTLPTVAFVRHPFQRWIAGYTMWILDLARFSNGTIVWEPPHHFTYDAHTTLQRHFIDADTRIIRLDDIDQWATRCAIKLPHLHKTSQLHRWIQRKTSDWLTQNPVWLDELNTHLQIDYNLYDRAESVQSLPENFFTR